MACSAWLRPIMFHISSVFQFCDVIMAFDTFAFVYNVTIILNRWLTFFMVFKR